MSWLRLYADAIDDPKLQMLAFEDRWHFIAILCCKKQGLLDGDDKEFAQRLVRVKLGLDQTAFEEMVKRLVAVKLIDRATLQPIAWDRRQYVSDQDPTHAERQRRYREKNKEPSRDATVTRHGNDQRQIQSTDTDIPSGKIEVIEARASRLPKNWKPTPEQIRWATDERPGLDANVEAEKFRDYWHAKAGQAATKRDWSATWRNWIRNARGVANVNPTRTPTAKPSGMQRTEDALREYVARAGA